jgi:flagellar basal-body rod protein FlgB
MPVTDLPLFSALKNRMYWLSERQRVLAENVANADTPGFRGHDLKQLDFNDVLKATGAVKIATTNPGHIGGGGGQFPTDNRGGFETTPRGNAVVLEDEMLKVAQTQMDHQAATALYSRSIGLIKTALGRR